MSSILKALKTLDETSPPAEKLDSVQKQKMKMLVNRRVKGPWLVNRFLPIALAVLFLGAVGWFISGQKNKLTPEPASNDHRLNNHRLDEPGVSAPSSIIPTVPAQKLSMSVTPLNTSTPPKKETPPTGKKIIPQWLDLQGIIWAEEPGNRHVIINGKDLKIGEFIKGNAVIHIGKESVTLQSGEEKWRIYL